MGVRKVCRSKNIQLKIIKLNVESFSLFICQFQNYCIKRGEFPNDLKHADVLSAYMKKKGKCDKTNHRPFNIFSNILNLFKGHSKGYSSQYSALNVTVHLKESVNKVNAFRAFLADFSKAFDCIDKTFLTAKLFAFGVLPLSLKLVHRYLPNRTQ